MELVLSPRDILATAKLSAKFLEVEVLILELGHLTSQLCLSAILNLRSFHLAPPCCLCAVRPSRLVFGYPARPPFSSQSRRPC